MQRHQFERHEWANEGAGDNAGSRFGLALKSVFFIRQFSGVSILVVSRT